MAETGTSELGDFSAENAQILILDDSRLTRFRLSSDLSELGFTNLVMASTGNEFWEVLSTHTPDLILLDLILPDTDGTEILRKLRTKRKFTNTPVIVITSLKTGTPLVEAFAMGANDYLRKPWDSAELNARIRNHLQRQLAEKAVQRAKSEWENTFDAAPDMIALIGNDLRCRRVNKALVTHLQVDVGALIGQRCDVLLHGEAENASAEALQQTLDDGKPRHFEMHTASPDAHFWVSTSPVRDPNGAVTGVVYVVRDVSERVRMQKQLEYDASHDLMLGILNRNAWLDLLEREMANALRHDFPIAVALGDLDHFKLVNDIMGHQTGDEVLIRFANILSSVIRAGDAVGRYGGEEFALFFSHADLDGIRSHLESILEEQRSKAFTTPDGQERQVTASFGLTLLTPEDTTPDQVIARADNALYAAKESGRNRICVEL